MRTDEFQVPAPNANGYRFIAECRTGEPRVWHLQYRKRPVEGIKVRVAESLTDDAKQPGREPLVEYHWFVEDNTGIFRQGASPESERVAAREAFLAMEEIFKKKDQLMAKELFIVNDQLQFVRTSENGMEDVFYTLCTRDGRTAELAPATVSHNRNSTLFTYSIQCGEKLISDELRGDKATLETAILKCMETRQSEIDKHYPIKGSARVLANGLSIIENETVTEGVKAPDSWPVDPQYNLAGEGKMQFVQRGTRVFLCDNIGQRIKPYAVTIHLTDAAGFIKQKDFHWEVDLGEGRCWKSPSVGFLEDAGRAAMAARAAIMHIEEKREQEPKAHGTDERELLRLHGVIAKCYGLLQPFTPSMPAVANQVRDILGHQVKQAIADFVVAGEVYRVYLSGAKVKVHKVETGGELVLTVNTNGTHQTMLFAFPFDAQNFIESYFDVRGKTEVQFASNVIVGFSRLAREHGQ